MDNRIAVTVKELYEDFPVYINIYLFLEECDKDGLDPWRIVELDKMTEEDKYIVSWNNATREKIVDPDFLLYISTKDYDIPKDSIKKGAEIMNFIEQENLPTQLVQNGKIRSTFLGYEDHGIFTFLLRIEGGGWGQGAGNYFLDTYDKELKCRIHWNDRVGRIVSAILKVLELENWEQLPGQMIRVVYDNTTLARKIIGIGHIIKDQFILFEEILKE